MNFKERVPFGKTGLMMSRIGLASGFGVPTAAIEKAFHEYGVNYLWLSVFMPRGMVRAIHNLAPKHRDELRIVLAKPTFGGFFLQSFVERWLKKLQIEQADLVVLQAQRKPLNQKLVDRIHRLRDSGKVRFVGMSSHERPLFGKLLKPKLMPAGERPLAAADCYRFVLSHPDVNVCLTAPSTAAQMEDNLKALDAGPLDEEEMARVRRIGKHIYEKE